MQRLYGLDLIRGLLALIVAAYHFMAYSDLGVHYTASDHTRFIASSPSPAS